ncbi:MAG: flippase [Pirellulaceae bacterium]
MNRTATLRTSKNAFMLLAGTMTRMIASFVFVIYCSAILGVDGFGIFTIATHYLDLFMSLTAAAVGILLTRDIARWPRHLNQLLGTAVALVCLLAGLSPLIMYGISRMFGYSAETHDAMMIAAMALIPAAIAIVLEAVFVALERAEFVTIGSAIDSIVRIGLGVAVLALGYGLNGLMWSLVVVRVLLCIAYLIMLRRLVVVRLTFHRRRAFRFIRRWRVFAAENWMATIYTNLDVILLSWLSGEHAVGLYSAAWKIVRLGTVVAKSYTTAIYPVMSRMFSQSRDSFDNLYRHTIRIMCTLALPAIAVITVIPDRMIDLIFEPEYAEAAAVLQVLIWVLLIEFLNPFLSHVLFAQGKQERSMIVAAISLSVNLVATYLLIESFGAVGAAAGTILGGFVATCCYLSFANPPQQIMLTAWGVLRVFCAAAGLGLAVANTRDLPWLAIIPLCVVVYTLLLFLVGAVRLDDVRYFKTTFLNRATTP